MAEERLDEAAGFKLRGLLAAGDPDGSVGEAWRANLFVTCIASTASPSSPGRWIDGLITTAERPPPKEVRGMASTLKRWRDQILAWHTTGASNGPTEGLNSIIKKVKRVSGLGSGHAPTSGCGSCEQLQRRAAAR